MFSTDTKDDQGIIPGEALNELEMVANRPTPDPGKEIEAESSEVFLHGRTHIGHGSVLIAAITSCTNTSNPSVMIAAGLLAKKAVERGLRVDPGVKTSLAPGSRVVSDYLEKTGLQTYLDQLGFNLVGYGCTTRRQRCFHRRIDRKSTRLNSSHTVISYAVFCLKKKNCNPKHNATATCSALRSIAARIAQVEIRAPHESFLNAMRVEVLNTRVRHDAI